MDSSSPLPNDLPPEDQKPAETSDPGFDNIIDDDTPRKDAIHYANHQLRNGIMSETVVTELVASGWSTNDAEEIVDAAQELLRYSHEATRARAYYDAQDRSGYTGPEIPPQAGLIGGILMLLLKLFHAIPLFPSKAKRVRGFDVIPVAKQAQANTPTVPPPPSSPIAALKIPEQETFVCPDCHGEIQLQLGADVDTMVCPHCNHSILVQSREGIRDVFEESDPLKLAREDELNGNKIRQLSVLRQAAYRSRSYCIVAFLACIIIGIQLNIMAVEHFNYDKAAKIKPLIFLLISIPLYIGSVYFFNRARKFHEEASQHNLDEPIAPPDFSTLSDGSQQWKNLEAMHQPPPPEENKSSEWKS